MPRFAAHLFAKIAALVAVVTICGGHWAALKTVAWAGMLWDYAQGATLQEAVVKTFDGKHPCNLCVTIDEGRQHEEKAPTSAQIKVAKFEAVRPVQLFLGLHSPVATMPRTQDASALAWREAPPTPPPLAA